MKKKFANKLTVLITGAGAPGAPGIISSLRLVRERKFIIIGTDIKSQVSTSPSLNYFYKVSKPEDDFFIKNIFEICLKHKVDIILPLVTKELEIFSVNKTLFNSIGVKISVADQYTLQITNDKGKLFQFLEDKGIIVPQYFLVKTLKQFILKSKELGFPKNPFCFKPTQSNGSRGFRIVDNNKNLKELLFNEKPNSTYINFDNVCKILKDDNFPTLMVMEYLPGEEYSVDILSKKGIPLYVIPRLRDEMASGISKTCTLKMNEDIIKYCTQISKVLKFDGIFGIQAKYDKNGTIKILEINPRLQGSIVACVGGGINLPYFVIKQLIGEKIPNYKIKWETRMTRNWKETFFTYDGHAFTF